MTIVGKISAGIASFALCITAIPAHAAPAMQSAEKVRKLDIMLMVTALRCRTTAFGFQDEYNRFASNHLGELNQAAQVLRTGLAQRLGPQAAERALDRMSVVMANRYGLGHPTLGCDQLQQEARALSRANKPGALLAAADRLLVDRDGMQFAARR